MAGDVKGVDEVFGHGQSTWYALHLKLLAIFELTLIQSWPLFWDVHHQVDASAFHRTL